MTTAPPAHPARRPNIEAWLDELGAKWRFDGDLRLNRIDQAASLANQARHEALNAEVVERYTVAMANGDQFPPLIIRDTDDPLGILGGNHRYAAHLNNSHTTAPAYIVKADDQTVIRMRFEDNAKHGLPPTRNERIVHAVAFIAAGMTQTEAANVVGLNVKTLSRAGAAIRSLERANALGVDPGFQRVAEAIREAIGRCTDDTVFTAAANLTVRARLTMVEARNLANTVEAVHPTEALRLIGAEEEDMATRIREGRTAGDGRTARARLDNAMAIIRGLSPADIVASCPNADVAATLAQRILDTATVLAKTRDRLTAPKSVA